MNTEDRILDKLQKIEISIAVTHEKLSTITKRLDNASNELVAIEKRVDRHDKMVGAVIMAVAILAVLVRFKLI